MFFTCNWYSSRKQEEFSIDDWGLEDIIEDKEVK